MSCRSFSFMNFSINSSVVTPPVLPHVFRSMSLRFTNLTTHYFQVSINVMTQLFHLVT
jgi:hypothetical protein